MAKLERTLNGDLDVIAQEIKDTVLKASLTATLEDCSSFYGENARCIVYVFERYSSFGGNRVSMNVTLFQSGDGPVQLSAITSGGSQAMLFKVNTVGEESFLNTLKSIF